MRRFLGRAFTFAAAVSAVLFVATVVLWGRCQWTGFGPLAFPPHTRMAFYRDTVMVIYEPYLGGPRAILHPTRQIIRVSFWYILLKELRRTDLPGEPLLVRWLTLPYWLILLPTAPAPVAWGASWTRTRRIARRVARGLCPACGYDLRATPERCPECGTVPVHKGAA